MTTDNKDQIISNLKSQIQEYKKQEQLIVELNEQWQQTVEIYKRHFDNQKSLISKLVIGVDRIKKLENEASKLETKMIEIDDQDLPPAAATNKPSTPPPPPATNKPSTPPPAAATNKPSTPPPPPATNKPSTPPPPPATNKPSTPPPAAATNKPSTPPQLKNN